MTKSNFIFWRKDGVPDGIWQIEEKQMVSHRHTRTQKHEMENHADPSFC